MDVRVDVRMDVRVDVRVDDGRERAHRETSVRTSTEARAF
jgi:hypothetical protein